MAACEVIIALNIAESHAIEADAPIFVQGIICEESLPAGAFIQIVGIAVDNLSLRYRESQINAKELHINYQLIINTLEKSKCILESLVKEKIPNDSDNSVDTRVNISEAWFSTMNSLLRISFMDDDTKAIFKTCKTSRKLVSDSVFAVIVMILNHDQGMKCDEKVFVTMDYAHTLVIVEFLKLSVAYLPSIFEDVGSNVQQNVGVRLDSCSDGLIKCNWYVGAVVFTAVILLGSSGALPPWAIEYMPEIFQSMFLACASDGDRFLSII